MARDTTSKWILYNIVVCFAVYWLSNLILWYPWSLNETLGQTLMLTINPLLWGFASYRCLIRYPGLKLIQGVILNSAIFVAEAMLSDFIFFVVIRHAAEKLFLPTTFYGWGFVFFVPFINYALFKKRIEKNKRSPEPGDYRRPLVIGLISFAAIILILIFHIKFN